MSIKTIRIIGGRLCLNLVNTVHDRFEEPILDYLNTTDDLIRWSGRTAILDKEEVNSVQKTEAEHDSELVKLLAETIQLRQLLYTIFVKTARNQEVSPKTMNDFNKRVASAFSNSKLVEKKGKYYADWVVSLPQDKIIPSIIQDAYDLLLLNKPERIKECPRCGWLFFDTSKNGKRKWCSMETCGSQEKATQWYHRNKI